MSIPGVHIETLRNPTLYTAAQIDEAWRVAYMLDRGKLVLLMKPEGSPPEEDE